MPDIFLSYSRQDQEAARRFAAGFERAGMSVWWDAALNPGEAFDEVTERALAEAGAVVVLWSKHSVASRWVRAEATQALESRTLVPVMIESCKRPIMFELTHTLDMSGWRGDPRDKDWQSLLAGVRRLAHKDAMESGAAAPTLANWSWRSRVGPIVIAATALLFLVTAIWLLRQRNDGNAQFAARTVTLAVLPFANLSSDAEQEYFTDGLTEEILNQLALVQGLSVTARTSSFSFKGKNEDVRVIGRKLGVTNLLEGSIRRDGQRLRITAQLIKSRDGSHLWSRTYDRELGGVFALQEEIARDVTDALSVTLDLGEFSRAKGGTNNFEAYEKALQAHALLKQDAREDKLFQAAQLGRDAVSLDPAYLRAWEILISALERLRGRTPQEEAALASELVEAKAHAVALAPDGVFAQYLLYVQAVAQRKWTEASVAALGIEKDPEWRGFMVFFLANVGRVREASRSLEANRNRDPLSLSVSGDLQTILDADGRRADAQAEYLRSKDLVGNHGRSEFLASIRAMKKEGVTLAAVRKELPAVLKGMGKGLAPDPAPLDSLDSMGEARAVVRRAFEDRENQETGRMGNIAMIADALGDTDLALAALRRGVVELDKTGDASYQLWLAYAPGLRADQRFKEILRELGLVDYFRASGNWGDFCRPDGDTDFECH